MSDTPIIHENCGKVAGTLDQKDGAAMLRWIEDRTPCESCRRPLRGISRDIDGASWRAYS